MGVDWGTVGTSTAQGAAAGSVVPGGGTAIGAGIGFIGGILGSNAANAQAKLTNMWLGRAWGISRPKAIFGLANRLLPYERNMIATAAGPQLQQQIAGNIAARGLSGTGLGLAMQNAALIAPGAMAAQNALNTSITMRGNQANIALASAGKAQAKLNPLISGVMGAARGAFSMGNYNAQPQQATSPNLFPSLTGFNTGNLGPMGDPNQFYQDTGGYQVPTFV